MRPPTFPHSHPFLPIFGNFQRQAQRLQHFLQQQSVLAQIFHNQQSVIGLVGSQADHHALGAFALLFGQQQRLLHRNAKIEARPLPQHTLHPNFAAQQMHQLLAQRQAQPRPLLALPPTARLAKAGEQQR